MKSPRARLAVALTVAVATAAASVSALSRRGLVRLWCPGAAAHHLEKPYLSVPSTISHVIPVSTFQVLK